MARDANTTSPDHPARSEPASHRWRGWRIVVFVLGAVLVAWMIPRVIDAFSDPMEREVARLMEPVRRSERNERPFYRWVKQFENGPGPLAEVSRWILGEANTSNQPTYSVEAFQDLGAPVLSILLRLATKDSSPAVRAVAIESLGTLGVTNAFAGVSHALTNDGAANVRAAAAEALGRIDPRAAGTPLLGALAQEKEESVRFSVVRALGTLESTVAFDPLIHVLKSDPSVETRRTAVEALAQLGDLRAAPTLRSLLATTNDNGLTTALIGALGELRDRQAVPELLALLEAMLPSAPKSAGSPTELTSETAPPGVPVQQPWYESTRQPIAHALGQIGDARATDALARTLPQLTREWEIQTFLDALGAIGDPNAIPALRSVIADQPKFASRAAQVLAQIGNAETTRELIALLDSPDRETRVAAAIALASLGEKAAVTNLLEAMTRGPQQDAKRNIVEALGVVGDTSAVPHLIQAAKDTEEDVRTQAIWSLGHIGDRSASDALLGALKDSAFGVRFAAAFALAGMTNAAALPALDGLLGDQERRVRTAAACSLAFHGSERGLTQLANALKRLDDWQRFGAVVALLRLNSAAARELANGAVHDRDDGIRKLAGEALERGAVSALVKTLKEGSDDHRHYAARMLLFFDDPSAIPALRGAVRDTRMEVRVAARVALRRLERTTAGK